MRCPAIPKKLEVVLTRVGLGSPTWMRAAAAGHARSGGLFPLVEIIVDSPKTAQIEDLAALRWAQGSPLGSRRVDDQRHHDEWYAALTARLAEAVQGHTIRQVARIVNLNAESTRRYLRGDRPSVRFIAALSRALGVSADWILNGIEPSRRPEVLPPLVGPSLNGVGLEVKPRTRRPRSGGARRSRQG